MMTDHRLPLDNRRSVTDAHFDMEGLIGYILLSGVLLSVALIAAGLSWHLVVSGNMTITHRVSGLNLFRFLVATVRLGGMPSARPDLLVNLGIGVLMLTPYVRVLGSAFYFALVEHNRKYTGFTIFVLSVLTYILFIR
jgi:uncharacterized membrane protein